jgi:RNA polymerase sigma factor for flagellar operon FliA
MDPHIKLLWKYYKDYNDTSSRDKLIEYYTPFLKKITKYVYSKLPNTIQLSEIESYANLGLLDSIEKYNYKRGIEFETYAKIRIKGAIIDEIRRQDWLPRSIRKIIKEKKDIEMNGGKMEELSIEDSNDDNMQLCKESNFYNGNFYNDVISLNEIILDSQEISDINFEEVNFNNANVDFVEELVKKLSIQKLILKLNKIEKKIVYLYYFEGMTFKEIGKLLNLTESRISQIHKKALSNLRKIIKDFY